MGILGDSTGFWLIAVLLAGGIAAALIASLIFARRHQDEPELAQDIRLYREQLAGIERDAARAVLSEAEAGNLRAEIGRRLLDADRQSRQAAVQSRAGKAALVVPVLAVLAATGGAFAIYARLGQPGAPDQPMALRLDIAEERMASRPSQAEYIARLPATLPLEPEPAMVEPLAKLRETVDPATSDSLQGLELRATIEARLGNFPDAIASQTRLISLRGEDASPRNYGDLVLMLVEQAQGYVSPETEDALVAGLKLADRASLDQVADLLLAAAQGFQAMGKDAATLDALPPVNEATGPLFLFAGELYAQGGRPDRAFALWRPLMESGPQDAYWVPQLREQIRAAAWYAGAWDYQLPAAPAGPELRGPDAGAIAGASGMDQGEVREMAEGMASGLRSRLLADGGSGREWAQLIQALSVLGEDDEARAMLALGLEAHPGGEDRAVIEAAGAAIGSFGSLP